MKRSLHKSQALITNYSRGFDGIANFSKIIQLSFEPTPKHMLVRLDYVRRSRQHHVLLVLSYEALSGELSLNDLIKIIKVFESSNFDLLFKNSTRVEVVITQKKTIHIFALRNDPQCGRISLCVSLNLEQIIKIDNSSLLECLPYLDSDKKKDKYFSYLFLKDKLHQFSIFLGQLPKWYHKQFSTKEQLDQIWLLSTEVLIWALTPAMAILIWPCALTIIGLLLSRNDEDTWLLASNIFAKVMMWEVAVLLLPLFGITPVTLGVPAAMILAGLLIVGFCWVGDFVVDLLGEGLKCWQSHREFQVTQFFIQKLKDLIPFNSSGAGWYYISRIPGLSFVPLIASQIIMPILKVFLLCIAQKVVKTTTVQIAKPLEGVQLKLSNLLIKQGLFKTSSLPDKRADAQQDTEVADKQVTVAVCNSTLNLVC